MTYEITFKEGNVIWSNVYKMAIPKDVYLRASRLKVRYGRSDYVSEWCEWQYNKEKYGLRL